MAMICAISPTAPQMAFAANGFRNLNTRADAKTSRHERCHVELASSMHSLIQRFELRDMHGRYDIHLGSSQSGHAHTKSHTAHLLPVCRLSFFCRLLMYCAVLQAGCDSKAAAPTADSVSRPRCILALSAIACICILDAEALPMWALKVSLMGGRA